MRATTNNESANNKPSPRLQNSFQQQVEDNQQQEQQHVTMNPNDYLVPLMNNSSSTTFGSNHSKSTTEYRYHPYARNSNNDHCPSTHSTPIHNNYENQYARTIHNNQNMQSVNFSNNNTLYDVRMQNNDNIRNIPRPQFTSTTLLEPSVQVEPHFDSNIFTILRKRHVVGSSSSSLSSLTSSEISSAPSTRVANYGTPSSTSLESPNIIDPSPNPSISLRTISTDSVSYRSSNRGDSKTNPYFHQESATHPPSTLIPLGDNFKNNKSQHVNEQPGINSPLITQNYSLTPLNLLQKSNPTLASSSSANNSIELVSSSGQYLEPSNPSSYLRPLKSSNPSSSNDLSNLSSSAPPFSDPIVLDLSKIPSTFDEPSNFNYSKTKRIKNFVNDGPWTNEEHERLLQGLQQCGTNWKELSEVYVKSRTRVQVHAYATKVLKIKSPNNDP